MKEKVANFIHLTHFIHISTLSWKNVHLCGALLMARFASIWTPADLKPIVNGKNSYLTPPEAKVWHIVWSLFFVPMTKDEISGGRNESVNLDESTLIQKPKNPTHCSDNVVVQRVKNSCPPGFISLSLSLPLTLTPFSHSLFRSSLSLPPSLSGWFLPPSCRSL